MLFLINKTNIGTFNKRIQYVFIHVYIEIIKILKNKHRRINNTLSLFYFIDAKAIVNPGDFCETFYIEKRKKQYHELCNSTKSCPELNLNKLYK